MPSGSHSHSTACTVGIGIPVKNEELTIEASIASAMSQSHPAVRIFVSDNASEDTSTARIVEIARKTGALEVHRFEVSVSAPQNFAKVFELAQRECCFFMWLGAHDLVPPHYVTVLIEQLLSNESFLAVPSASVFVPTSLLSSLTASCGNNFTAPFELDIRNHSPIADTEFASKLDQVVHLTDHLVNCTPFHGLWRTSGLRGIPLLATRAADHAVLLHAAVDSTIQRGEVVYVRGVPPTHGLVSRDNRYRKNGIKTGVGSVLQLAMHATTIVLAAKAPLMSRRRLSAYVGSVFFLRFVSRKAQPKLIRSLIRQALRLVRHAGRRYLRAGDWGSRR